MRDFPMPFVARKDWCHMCRFWCQLYDNQGHSLTRDGAAIGQCRRHAPRARWFSRWTVTLAQEWCGDFEPLPPK